MKDVVITAASFTLYAGVVAAAALLFGFIADTVVAPAIANGPAGLFDFAARIAG